MEVLEEIWCPAEGERADTDNHERLGHLVLVLF